ncbi:ROK family protein [Afifella aestuarii]|uniref:ROK family protein n=1 Tax=Afifella aestuarii TaxID=1909496 RepID=UPI0013E329A2|nr:ROK family protein [Afifella aestuarii]
MTPEFLFAVDVGGSSVKLGIVDGNGVVVAKSALPFPSLASFEALVEGAAESLDALARTVSAAPEAIGIAAPGYADPATGLPLDGTGNVPLLQGGSLAAELARRLNVPAATDNDAISATLGELEFGVGRRVSSFALITVGTGIGGALVIDRRIVRGRDGKPPEFGAMVLEPGHPYERYGLHGTFEDLAGGKAVIAAYAAETGEAAEDLSMSLLRERALAGDARADAAFETMGRYIAQAFGTMINLTAIELCVVGGGISLAGGFLLDRIRRHLRANTWPYLVDDARILATEHGNDSGLIGAAAMVRRRLNPVAGENVPVIKPSAFV